jgi:putative inorganic carbon (hco3(-)) transporter
MRAHSRTAGPVRGPIRRSGELPLGLLQFRVKALWAALQREPAPFWLLCFYVMVEYLRPQSMYPVLNVLPWGQTSLLLLVASVVLSGLRPKALNLMDGLFLAFSAVVVVSGLSAWDPSVSWDARNTYLSWFLLYFCTRAILTSPRRMLLFWVLLALVNFKMSRHGASVFFGRGMSFSGYGISGAPGWFHNSGELALQMCVAFALTWTLIEAHRDFMTPLRRYVLLVLFPLTAFVTVIGSSSRGGQIALVVVCVALAGRSKRALRGIAVAGLLLVVGWGMLPAEQKARFSAMGDDETSQSRLEIWEDARTIAAQHPFTGIGYGNWRPFYSTWAPANSEYYRPGRPLLVIHNTVLEAFVDLGVPGGALFLSMIVTALMMNHRTGRRFSDTDAAGRSIRGMVKGLNLGIIAMVIAAQFMSVLFYPVFWLAFALTASFAVLQTSAPAAPGTQRKLGMPSRKVRKASLRGLAVPTHR